MSRLEIVDTRAKEICWVQAILEDLASKRWFGEVVIKIEHGNIVLVKKSESMKPPR